MMTGRERRRFENEDIVDTLVIFRRKEGTVGICLVTCDGERTTTKSPTNKIQVMSFRLHVMENNHCVLLGY